jgi:hypothetical protein
VWFWLCDGLVSHWVDGRRAFVGCICTQEMGPVAMGLDWTSMLGLNMSYLRG